MRDTPATRDDFDVVHAHVLAGYRDLVVELGGDPEDLVRLAGIATCAADLREVTCRQWVRLLELSALRLSTPDFGMRLAARQGGEGVFGPLGNAMRRAPSFGDALAYVEAHCYAHSLASRIAIRRGKAGGLSFVSHDLLVGRNPVPVQAIEQLMLAGHLGAQAITGGHARARRVHFRHEPSAGLPVYRRHFGCEVRFGQVRDGVCFSQADLACPTIDSDEAVLAEITRDIEARFRDRRAPVDAQVLASVLHRLLAGDCSNQAVAADLGMHARTLHRRLSEAGTSFHRIKDAVRRDIMLYYLERTSFSLTWIAARLGFAEQAVMSRNCRRWFGASPSSLRAASGASPASDILLARD